MMRRPCGITLLSLCTSAAFGGSVQGEKQTHASTLPSRMPMSPKSSLMRAEDLNARTMALSSSGRPEPLHRTHSMIEEHSFVVDAHGQRVVQNNKEKSLSTKRRVDLKDEIKGRLDLKGDCVGNADEPLCIGQNKSNVVDVQKEIDLAELMIKGVALYCCCGDAKVSSQWQEQLRKQTVPGYCKKSWYNRYCKGLNSEYSPSEAVLNEDLGRQQQMELCDVCHECFQKKCPFWDEGQQPVKKLWIDAITCKEATTPFAEPGPEITDLEVKRELEEANECAVGSIKCPSNIHLAFQQYPAAVILLLLLFVAQCAAGAFYVKYRYQVWEEIKGNEEQAPILDPSLIPNIKDQ